jgi:hypothetical protein
MNSIMTSQAASERDAERVHVDHGVTKRLGRWTSASQFDVRVRPGPAPGPQERRLPDRGRVHAPGRARYAAA